MRFYFQFNNNQKKDNYTGSYYDYSVLTVQKPKVSQKNNFILQQNDT